MNKKFVFMICIFPIATIFSMVSDYLLIPGITTKGEVIISLLVNIVLIVANILIFFLIERQMEIEFNKQKLFYFKQQLEQQRKYYKNMYEKHEQIKRISHVMKSRMLVIQTLIINKDYDSALAKIEHFSKNTMKAPPIIKTRIPSLDAILTEYYEKSNQDAIHFDFNIKMSEENINIDVMEIIVIVENLLSNAYEAVICANKVKKI